MAHFKMNMEDAWSEGIEVYATEERAPSSGQLVELAVKRLVSPLSGMFCG
jgi:hypothetical protein